MATFIITGGVKVSEWISNSISLYWACNYLPMLRLNMLIKAETSILVSDKRDQCKWHQTTTIFTLQCRHNECYGVWNHQPHDCLLHILFRRRWKKTSKRRVTDLCAWNSPVTGEFPAQRASNAENVSIWWRHHEIIKHTGFHCDVDDTP